MPVQSTTKVWDHLFILYVSSKEKVRLDFRKAVSSTKIIWTRKQTTQGRCRAFVMDSFIKTRDENLSGFM